MTRFAANAEIISSAAPAKVWEALTKPEWVRDRQEITFRVL